MPKSAHIDCQRYIVTDLAGKSLMPEISGDFFELAVGDNTMTVVSAENVEVEVEYNPKYINSIDTEDLRLGD